jgi:hypothetical protein
MSDHEGDSPQKRQYPPFYEKVVPVALGIIVLVIVILVIVILGVALGLFPGTA